MVALALGLPVSLVAIRPGKRHLGLTMYDELPLPAELQMCEVLQQPAELRTHVESRILATLAGDIARAEVEASLSDWRALLVEPQRSGVE